MVGDAEEPTPVPPPPAEPPRLSVKPNRNQVGAPAPFLSRRKGTRGWSRRSHGTSSYFDRGDELSFFERHRRIALRLRNIPSRRASAFGHVVGAWDDERPFAHGKQETGRTGILRSISPVHGT